MNARDDLESAQDVPVSAREHPVSVHDDYGRHRMAKDMPIGLESGYNIPRQNTIFSQIFGQIYQYSTFFSNPT